MQFLVSFWKTLFCPYSRTRRYLINQSSLILCYYPARLFRFTSIISNFFHRSKFLKETLIAKPIGTNSKQVYLSVCLSVCPSVRPSVGLSALKVGRKHTQFVFFTCMRINCTELERNHRRKELYCRTCKIQYSPLPSPPHPSPQRHQLNACRVGS